MGTDAMLLGAWSTQHMGAHAAHVLDVGTGSGVLALMAAQRAQPHSRVHAVDVDPTACAQAAANAGGSPLRDQIVVFHATLQQLVAMHQGRAQAQPSTDGDAVAATAPAEDGSAGGTGSAVASSRSMSTAPGLSMGSAGSSEDGGANGGSHSMHGQVLPAQAWLGQAPSQGYDVIISNPPFFERSSKPPVQPQPQGPGKKGKKKKNQQSQVSEGKTTSEAGEGLGAQTASTTTSLSSLSRDEAPDREQQQQQQEGASASGQEEGPETQPGQGSRRAGRVLGARRALARHADAVVQLDAVQGQASSGAVSGTSLSTDGEGQLQPQVQVQEQAGLPFEALAAGAAALLAPGGALFVVLPVMGGESDRFARLAAAQGLRLVGYVARACRLLVAGAPPLGGLLAGRFCAWVLCRDAAACMAPQVVHAPAHAPPPAGAPAARAHQGKGPLRAQAPADVCEGREQQWQSWRSRLRTQWCTGALSIGAWPLTAATLGTNWFRWHRSFRGGQVYFCER